MNQLYLSSKKNILALVDMMLYRSTVKRIHKKSVIHLLIIFTLFVQVMNCGCIGNEGEQINKSLAQQSLEESLILPEWTDGLYHDYVKTTQFIKDLNGRYSDLVEFFSIGKSVERRDIWCVKITNERNTSLKNKCVIDGCIHGNEWESGELCLYLAEYLVLNFGNNKSVSKILNSSIVYLIPLLNPDGRQIDNRFNGNGVDLNRNFDVHFGRFRGGSMPLGSIGKIHLSYIRFPLLNKVFPRFFPSYVTNCGREPFSEPETHALKRFLDSINRDEFSFYVNGHTAMHFVGSVINIDYKPEFSVTDHEKKVLNTALYWIDDHTEYDIIESKEYSFYGAGYAHHWVFKNYKVPSFLFEMYSTDFEPGISSGGPHKDLVNWMKESLPVLLFLLANSEQLMQWDIPHIEPTVPEDISSVC